MSTSLDPDSRWLVACMCAAWCRTCGEYRAAFDRLSSEFAAQARCVWIDIEDDEEALGELDIIDFPTLLIARGDDIRFFGPVTLHLHVARQLVQRALRGELATVRDAALEGLAARIAALR